MLRDYGKENKDVDIGEGAVYGMHMTLVEVFSMMIHPLSVKME